MEEGEYVNIMSGSPIRSSELIAGMPGTPRKLMSQKNGKVTAVITAIVAGEIFSERKNAAHSATSMGPANTDA